MINKTQEVRGDEELEDDLDYVISTKEKVLIKFKKP